MLAKVKLSGQIILAPLAGVADSSYRMIAKEWGAALVFSELVSAEGLIRQSPKSIRLIQFQPEERPFGIQIFGSKDNYINAVHELEEYLYEAA